jgi:hypothetical protein
VIALLVIVVMAWVIASVVNLAARRPVVSAGRIGLILIALFVGLGVMAVVASGVEDMGFQMGKLLGQALLPVLLCVFFDRRHAARVKELKAALVLVALGLATAAQAQPVAVPASAFRDSLLRVPELGFQIASPGRDWAWTKAPHPAGKVVQYDVASPDATMKFMVNVVKPDAPQVLDLAEANGFVAGVAKRRVEAGWKADGRSCAPWAGMPAGFRCEVTLTDIDRQAFQYIAYIVSTDRFYAVQSLSTKREESPTFKAFAASFKLQK